MHAYERLKILFRALQRGSKFCRTFIDTNRDTTNTKILNPCTWLAEIYGRIEFFGNYSKQMKRNLIPSIVVIDKMDTWSIADLN